MLPTHFLEIRLDERKPLLDASLNVSSTLSNITNDYKCAGKPVDVEKVNICTYFVEIGTCPHRLRNRSWAYC